MIYHMCPTETWEAAVASGAYTGTEQDRRDGFLHFSTAAQIVESARRHRARQSGLVLLTVDADFLGERLRWEPSRDDELFPHLYGTLKPEDVARIDPLPLDRDGLHIFPPLA
jgi:uncharacterized protein (DUF952 family)